MTCALSFCPGLTSRGAAKIFAVSANERLLQALVDDPRVLVVVVREYAEADDAGEQNQCQ